MINLFLILLGMIINDSCAIILGTVVLMPVIHEIGIHPIHFAAIMGIANALGMSTPPVAPVLYLSQRVSGAEFSKMLKPIFVMIVFAYFPVMILTSAFPEIGLWLPRTLGYIR
jgi:TRAP-type C4-dicarboxylate transport system permease large subunit